MVLGGAVRSDWTICTVHGEAEACGQRSYAVRQYYQTNRQYFHHLPGRVYTDVRHWIDSIDATLFLKAVYSMGKELLRLNMHREIFPRRVEQSDSLNYVHLMYSSLDELFTGTLSYTIS